MLDRLFERRAAVERHLNGSLLDEPPDYLRQCPGQGYKPSRLRQLANDLLRIRKLLRLPASSNAIDPAAVERVARTAAVRVRGSCPAMGFAVMYCT